MSHPITRREAAQRLAFLFGGAVSAPTLAGLLGGCRTGSGSEVAAYSFQALSEAQQRSLAALVDAIIPATETPGAADVGVPQFIDKMLAGWYAPEERTAFLAGLAAVDQRAGGSFDGLDAAARTALVTQLDAEAYAPTGQPAAPAAAPDSAAATDDDVVEAGREGTYQAEEEAKNEVAGMQGDLGEAQADSAAGTAQLNTGEGTAAAGAPEAPPPFFRQLKELTLAGYYTSEAGATQELQWLASPGRWDADATLAEAGGRAWA